MDLKDFVKNVLMDINQAVDEAREQTTRDIKFSEKDNARTIEFDIAVSAETIDTKSGKTGIKVLHFAEAGGDISKENKNATVSRVTFGLQIDRSTKDEHQETAQKMHARNQAKRNSWPNQP